MCSKADNSRLNLPHCTITEKNNDKKLKTETRTKKAQKYRKKAGNRGVSPKEREKSLRQE